MSRRKVLGADPLSWIKPTIHIEKNASKEDDEFGYKSNEANQSELTHRNNEIPKFQTYEVILTLRLREDQLEFLTKLEREIMKKRSRNNKKERITKNSIIRAIIDAVRNLNINANEIGEEKELVVRFKQAYEFKRKTPI